MATVRINSGSGTTVTINEPGQGATVIPTQVAPMLTGDVSLAGSSGLSKAFNSGTFTDFEMLSISGLPKVKISGTVNRVLFYLNLLPTGTFTDFHVRVWRKDGATYDLVGQFDIPKAQLVDGTNEHTVDTPFDVEVGDYVGVGYSGQSTNSNLKVSIGANGSGRFNNSYPNTDTDMNWDGATSTTIYVKVQLIQENKQYISGRRGGWSGDSTVADFFVNSIYRTATTDLLLTDDEVQNGYQCYSIATPNDTIAQQQATWNALTNHDQYNYWIVQVGLNDMNPAEAASVAIARMQDYIDDIRALAPDIFIIIATMTPARARWDTLYGANAPIAQQKWEDMNEAYMGNGANPITGVDYRFDWHTTAMADPGWYLKPEYDTGDGIHENESGGEVLALNGRQALINNGFLPA